MRPRREVVILPLTRDGRLTHSRFLDPLHERLPGTTDCFVFCHGWLNDLGEARDGADRFFAHVDQALRPLGDRVVPLRLAIHWPSRPFADPDPAAQSRRPGEDAAVPELVGPLVELVRGRASLSRDLLAPLCEAEVPMGPEEEFELDALARQVRQGTGRGTGALSPLHALSFWLMKRRAGQVGERLGRELLVPALATLGDHAPRVHLIGHSFGAKLVASALLGGVRPASLVLLLAAFSAFAFAEEVPGTRRPGFYRRVLTEGLVTGPIVALRSDHDHALGRLYPAATWGHPLDRAGQNQGRVAWVREVVARSAMGAAGARGVGAPEIDLVDVARTGLPRCVVNIDGSRVVTRTEWLIGAHRDIHHDEIGTLVALAAGLLTGGPSGARLRPVSPVPIA